MSQVFIYPNPSASANPSVGTNNSPAPSSSTEIGFIDNSNNLQGVSGSNPLPVTVQSVPTNQSVNLTQVNSQTVNVGTGTAGTGTQRVSVSSDSSLTSVGSITNALPAGTNTIGSINAINTALPAGTNLLGKIGIDQTTPGTTNGVQVNAALPAGSNIIGQVSIDQTTPGTTNGVQINAALPAGSNNIGSVNVANFPSTALPSAFYSGQQTSTGTAVAISGSQSITVGVIVQAKSTNTNSVYVGPSGVSSSTGFELQPGQATSMAVNNLNLVYVISTHSGDGVCYVGS